jgi:hypothetical protein
MSCRQCGQPVPPVCRGLFLADSQCGQGVFQYGQAFGLAEQGEINCTMDPEDLAFQNVMEGVLAGGMDTIRPIEDTPTPRAGNFALVVQDGHIRAMDANRKVRRIRTEVVSDDPQTGAVAASGSVVFAGQPAAGGTVTIGGVTYTFVSALTSPAVANEVLIGASAAATRNNLLAAVNGAAGAGTTYGTGTVANPLVSGSAASADMTVTARSVGPAGNNIGLSENATNITVSGAVLEGGVWALEASKGDTLYAVSSAGLWVALTDIARDSVALGVWASISIPD